MSKQTLLSRRRGPVVVSTLLLGWLVLNGSTPALAEKKRDGWNRFSRYSDSKHCRNEARRDQRYYQRDNYYSRNAYDYQRARDYRPQRYYQTYRSNNGSWNNNRYQAYDQNNYRYGDYYGRERSAGESALIIAGSSGAGAAVGGLLGGTKGAAVGAIAGGVAGLVYDRHTDNRR